MQGVVELAKQAWYVHLALVHHRSLLLPGDVLLQLFVDQVVPLHPTRREIDPAVGVELNPVELGKPVVDGRCGGGEELQLHGRTLTDYMFSVQVDSGPFLHYLRAVQYSFWESRWSSGQIGFHLDRPNPALLAHWADVADSGGSVLVPLCGKSHDLQWLAERGHTVRGVEFVRSAAEEYFEERGLEPHITTAGDVSRFDAARLEFYVADFFALTPASVTPSDFIYDRAALVAIEPSRRRQYIEQLHALSRRGARLLLVNFVHDIGSGPPHSIEVAELEEHCHGVFELTLRDERDILADEPRFAQRGATHMVEQVWLGSRIGD